MALIYLRGGPLDGQLMPAGDVAAAPGTTIAFPFMYEKWPPGEEWQATANYRPTGATRRDPSGESLPEYLWEGNSPEASGSEIFADRIAGLFSR